MTPTQPEPRSPEPRSEQLATLSRHRLIDLQTGPAYLLELGFDSETQGRRHDFRPALPLVVHW